MQDIINWEVNTSPKTLKDTLKDVVDKADTIQCIIPIRYFKVGTMSHSVLYEAIIIVNKLA